MSGEHRMQKRRQNLRRPEKLSQTTEISNTRKEIKPLGILLML